MAAITQWIKQTVSNLWDPEKDQRLQNLVRVLHRGISVDRKTFSLAAAVRGLDFSANDLQEAKEHVYRSFLERGWTDGKVTAKEHETLRWIARRLEIPGGRVQAINLGLARNRFAAALAQAMEDGILDAQEEERLRGIAASHGCELSQFARQFFQSEGEAFLRGIFLACVADGHISQEEWNYLVSAAYTLGIRLDELLQVIQPHAQRFVEHVLADAKADGRLSAHEDSTLRWLTDNLGLPDHYRQYIHQEVCLLRLLTEIDAGRLPTIPCPPGMEVRAGEIIHLHVQATWRDVRVRKTGAHTESHVGTLTLTDNRLLFSSPTKSQSLNYRKIISHRGGTHAIQVQIAGKPAWTFIFGQPSPIPYAAFSACVAMANQTRVAKSDESSTRHIPREVRQRVWQRYGGRCAECGASDYLEFDHVIPVAKGGSNTDANVQLLCRRCNLKKSDSI
jgi:tellurite resistance protein